MYLSAAEIKKACGCVTLDWIYKHGESAMATSPGYRNAYSIEKLHAIAVKRIDEVKSNRFLASAKRAEAVVRLTKTEKALAKLLSGSNKISA